MGFRDYLSSLFFPSTLDTPPHPSPTELVQFCPTELSSPNRCVSLSSFSHLPRFSLLLAMCFFSQGLTLTCRVPVRSRLVWLLIVSCTPPTHSDPNPQHTTLKLSFCFLYFTRLWAPWSQDHTLSLCPQNSAEYNILMRNFPCGPVAKAPCSQCRGPRFNPWSGNWIPHAAAKDSVCLSKDQRPRMLQLRAGQLNT